MQLFGAEITLIARGVTPSFAMRVGSNRGMTAGKCMAGTTGLEPATSAVTVHRKVVTYKKLGVTDGFFGRLRHPSGTLIGPLSDLRPLPCKPLPDAGTWVDERFGLKSNSRHKSEPRSPGIGLLLERSGSTVD